MARRKTTKTKGKTKARKTGATKKRKAATRATSSSQTGTKRIAALEAENRKLREEIATLREEQSDRPAPAFNLTADAEEEEAEAPHE